MEQPNKKMPYKYTGTIRIPAQLLEELDSFKEPKESWKSFFERVIELLKDCIDTDNHEISIDNQGIEPEKVIEYD